MRLGIDFGTTNSAAAVYDGSNLIPINIADSQILPSLIYIDRQQQATLGLDAARAYTQRETGRAVRWKTRVIGNIEVVVAGSGGSPIVYQQPISVTFDDAAYGRLLQSVKTALRIEHYHGTQIFDRFYTVDELIAIVLQYLKQQAEQQMGKPCNDVVIGRPVKFSDDPRISLRAEEIIYKAARTVGFQDISFHMEPVGALYLYHISEKTRRTVFVFDFGGGTLDLTIAEVGGGQSPNILATRGVLVGGDDLDRRIMQSLYPYFGDDPVNDQSLPHDIVDALRDWQTMPELSRPHYVDVFNDLRHSHPRPKTIDALQTLVSKNIGFSLFREIERVKRQLSTDESVELNFNYENIKIHEQITRIRFERLIRTELESVDEGIQRVLAEANVAPAHIDAVLRTGGSSLVPAFVDLLSRHFGANKLHAMDPLTSVVGGLAIIAHEDQGIRGRYPAKYMTKLASEPNKRNYTTYLMRVDAHCYVDRETVIRKVPVELCRHLTLRTAYMDREETGDTFLSFELPRPARVYVAYTSSAAELPHWLRSFTKDDMTIEIADEWWGIKEFYVYSKVFEAGNLTLGANQAAGCRGRIDTQYLVVIEGYLD